MTTLTYGNLPTFEEFQTAFDQYCPNGTYAITLGKTDSERCENYFLGNGLWTVRKLYKALNEITSEQFEPGMDVNARMDLVDCILTTLGFEWV